MCYDNEPREYPIKLVAQIPFQDKMNTGNLLANAKAAFQKIVDEIVLSENIVFEEYSTENGFDESFDIVHIFSTFRHQHELQLRYDDGRERILILPKLKFLSVRTWDYIRNYEKEQSLIGPGYHIDERMERCDAAHIGRMLDHFNNDENSYFMITNAPIVEVPLIAGEIGLCSLLLGQGSYMEMPRVRYQTSRGSVTLFPDEIMPVDMKLLQEQINDGYIMLSDGRYLPPKSTVQQCFYAFGDRVGLDENWEQNYDSWTNI